MASSIPQSLRDGLRQQGAESAALLAGGAKRLGWKAGFGTTAAMEMLGTSGPLAGFLTDATLAPSGASFDVSEWGKPVLEPEVAVRLGADVEAGAGRAEIEAAVTEVGAAIELVDLGEAGGDAGAILAANIFHRAFLLGDFVALGPDLSLGDVRIDVRANGEDYAIAADPVAALGDLAGVLGGMADLLAGSGDGLLADDVIITGAAVAPFIHVSAEQVEVRVGPSAVSATVL